MVVSMSLQQLEKKYFQISGLVLVQILTFQNGNSGSTTTGVSSASADLNTVATTNSHALRIMGIMEDPDNSDFSAAGIPLIVRINNHFNAPTGSIAQGTVSTTGV